VVLLLCDVNIYCSYVIANPCGTPPGPNATCVDGQWVFPVVITGNIFVEKDDTVTIVEDTFVQGDLVVTGTLLNDFVKGR
jgi:hypothetical protein